MPLSASTLEIDLSMAAHPPSPETKTTKVSDEPFVDGTSISGSFLGGIVEADVAVAKARRQQYITGFMAALINGREEVRISKFE